MQNTLKTNNCFNLYKAFHWEGFFYGIVKFNRKARKEFLSGIIFRKHKFAKLNLYKALRTLLFAKT